jgi:anti-anti-sigma factor
MTLETEEIAGELVRVRLTGRMDIAGVDAIAVPFAALAAAEKRRVIVDLSGVDFLASIGIRALLQNARAHKLREGGMVLLAPPPQVDAVLRAAGVPNVVSIVSDLQAAVAALAA